MSFSGSLTILPPITLVSERNAQPYELTAGPAMLR
jgi:hypothetical protein